FLSTANFSSRNSSAVDNIPGQESTDLTKLSSEEINKRLMTFFDVPDNWTKEEVKSGRGWRIEELRIKSNSDLHKLWYILYKERNMLMTMEQAAKDEVENMTSPERLVKVEDGMKNIEEVVKERNRAYWQLEVGDSSPAERRKAFRRDIFGRWRMIAC
ncbi:39S ribosomal protein L47, mitochondrial-like protein, partial [Euroglyphus maynei]